MKRMGKRIIAAVLAGAMMMSLAACGAKADTSSAGSTEKAAQSAGAATETKETVTGKAATIGVAFYTDSGPAVEATKAYLESLSSTLNVTFKYTVLTQTDEAANLSKIQELIASGVDGIISTMDLGTTSILQECEAAGVYYGGYICDYDTSFKNAYDQVFKNKFFVGTASDGQNPDDVNIGTTMFDSLKKYNDSHKDAPLTHVSMAIFPAYAFPSQQVAADQFVANIEDYNKTAEVKITVDPLNEETDVLQFSPMNTTYFSKHADSQAIISFAAATVFVYPTMVSAGTDKTLKLFTTGFNGGEEANFGSAGTQTYQQMTVSAVESITYPLVLLLNKINGVDFKDQPAEAERVSTSQFIINDDASLAKFEKNIYYTAKAENAIFTPDQVLQMTAYANPDATYANLKGILADMTIEDLK